MARNHNVLKYLKVLKIVLKIFVNQLLENWCIILYMLFLTSTTILYVDIVIQSGVS